MRIILKELHETIISLKIIKITNPKMDSQELSDAIDESSKRMMIATFLIENDHFRI